MALKTNPVDSTRTRIVEAAKHQFAAHGIAGARIERIAKAAATSKERVYAYFSSKEDLYAHVMNNELALIMEATNLDAHDLPTYAGQLFDYFEKNPVHFRLLNWGRMESADPTKLDEATQRRIQHKLDKIERAQADGHLDPAWAPIDVLALVNQIAVTYLDQVEIAAMASRKEKGKTSPRRAAVVAAVRLIFPPNRSKGLG